MRAMRVSLAHHYDLGMPKIPILHFLTVLKKPLTALSPQPPLNILYNFFVNCMPLR